MFVGNDTMDKCYIGSTAVDKLYMGNELVWPTGVNAGINNPLLWLRYESGFPLVSSGSAAVSPAVLRGTETNTSNFELAPVSPGKVGTYKSLTHRWVDAPSATAIGVGMWFRIPGTHTGYTSFFHRCGVSSVGTWEFYVGQDGDRMMMGGQIGGFWFDLKDSVASIGGGWHYLTAALTRRTSPTSTWDAALYVDDRKMTNTFTGRSSVGFPSGQQLLVGGDYNANYSAQILLDDFWYKNSAVDLSLHDQIRQSGRS